MQTLYEILEVRADATEEMIRASYHKLAKQFHPDLNPNDSEGIRMRQINEAYAVLSDPESRKNYDLQLMHMHQAYDTHSSSFGNPDIRYLIIVTPDKFKALTEPLVMLSCSWKNWEALVWSPEDYDRRKVEPTPRTFVLFLGNPEENACSGVYFARLNFQMWTRAGIIYAWDNRRGVICGDGDIAHKKDLARFAEEIKTEHETGTAAKTRNKLVWDSIFMTSLFYSLPTALVAIGIKLFSIWHQRVNREKMKQLQLSIGLMKFAFYLSDLNLKKLGDE